MKMESRKCIVLSAVRDVEEYSTDVQPCDIQFTKDEDIEYRSGTLYSSSGTTSRRDFNLLTGKTTAVGR